MGRWKIFVATAMGLAVTMGCRQNMIFNPSDGELLFRDDFSGTLETGWLLDGAAGDVSVSDREGFLTLFPPPEIPTGLQAGRTSLLREMEGDFVLITRMEFDTQTDLQSSGLVIQGLDGRTVLLGVSEINQIGFRGAIMLADRGPNIERGRALVRSNLAIAYLRLERTGTTYSGAISGDGVTFTAVGSLTNDLSDEVSVGLGTLIASACTSNCTARIPADFDFFEIREPEE